MRLYTGLCIASLVLSGCGSGGTSRPAPGSGPEPTADASAEESGDPTPAPEAIQVALDTVIDSADAEVFSFGGAVATCQALSCPQAERIYVRRGRTAAVADTSGFEFTETRRGVSPAKKEGRLRHGMGSTHYRSLAGWMEHGLFLVTARETSAHGSTMVDYEVLSIGDSSGTNPAAPAIGSATWSGTMAGFVESAASGDPAAPGDGDSFVDGDARITLPGLATGAPATVDVLFSNIVDRGTGARRADMAWDGVRLTDGAFGSPEVIAPILASDTDIRGKSIGTGIYGRFHGPGHEEVGGVFRRDGITGAFGAGRDRTP